MRYIIRKCWLSADIINFNNLRAELHAYLPLVRFGVSLTVSHASYLSTNDWLLVRLIDRAESDKSKLSHAERATPTLVEKKLSSG